MVAPISGVTNPAVTVAAQSASSRLASNFDTFLTLLTTQLKNQDPLTPMDSNEFTQQLVQFSGVEQQINQNKNLETLIAMTKSRSGLDAVSYLGKTVTVTDGSGALDDGKATWSYSLDGPASGTALVVQDSRGRAVYATRGESTSGAHEFVWNGKDIGGNQLPDGTYTLTVKSVLADGDEVKTGVKSQGVVSEVDLSGSEPMLMVGSMAVPMSRAMTVSAQ